MNPQDLAERQLFKFTGPPENWITAIKFMTWGLEEKYLARWQQIEAGDIFLMHSTSTNTIVKGAPSSIIGFGVVSPEFRRKDTPLWLQEIEQHKNIWPLLVPFSEIYLFSELRPPGLLEEPSEKNRELIISEAKELLSTASPLPVGFPQMGSFSSVKPEVVVKIFEQVGKFYLYDSIGVTRDTYLKPTTLKEVENIEDLSFRKAASLGEMSIIKRKTIKQGKATYTKDLQTLERAETAHQDTLKLLFDLLKNYGYATYYNQHVDLFAVKGDNSFLFEVKSLSESNFRPQARKGIVQLFEYEYFEIRKFFEDQGAVSKPNKAVIFSEGPKDMNYVNFMNNIDIGAGFFSESKLQSSGQKQFLQV